MALRDTAIGPTVLDKTEKRKRLRKVAVSDKARAARYRAVADALADRVGALAGVDLP